MYMIIYTLYIHNILTIYLYIYIHIIPHHTVYGMSAVSGGREAADHPAASLRQQRLVPLKNMG